MRVAKVKLKQFIKVLSRPCISSQSGKSNPDRLNWVVSLYAAMLFVFPTVLIRPCVFFNVAFEDTKA